MILVTTDLHLDDNPANEYRWEVWEHMYEARPDVIYILGDLCEKKDRHSGELVNNIAAQLRRFPRVVILMGNHDAPLKGTPYWEFLNDIPGVSFITAPTAEGRLLLLPHTADPVNDWDGIDFSLYDCIMCHYTVSGVVVHGGHVLRTNTIIQLPDIPIYSGDIHIPQEVGGITYVGAPHPKLYGEDHPYRMLVLDETTYQIADEIILNPIRKHALTVSSLAELQQIQVQPGDQAKIEFTIPAERIEQWPVEEHAIAEWAKANGIAVSTVRALVEVGERVAEGIEDELGSFAHPLQVLDSFMAAEGIEGDLSIIGFELLEATLKQEGIE